MVVVTGVLQKECSDIRPWSPRRLSLPVLKAGLELRDTVSGYFDVVFGFAAAEGRDQIAVSSANDYTAVPSELTGQGRARLAAAVLEGIGHLRRFGVGNSEQVGALVAL